MVKLPGFLGAQNPTLRSNSPLAIVRLVQLLLAVIILGITASNASDFNDYGCYVPSKLGYNIAVTVISFPILIYLILSAGPKHIAKLPWNQYLQLGLTVFLLILWIAALGSSVLQCNDICSACEKANIGYCGITTTIAGQYCSCTYANYNAYTCAANYPYDKRNVLVNASGYKVELTKRAKFSSASGAVSKSSKTSAQQGFDALEMILFLIATSYTVFLIFRGRKASPSTTEAQTGQPMQQDSQGGIGMMPPAGNYQQPQTQQTGGQADQYYNSNAGDGQYQNPAPAQQYGNSSPPPPQQFSPSPVGGPYGAPVSGTGTGALPGQYQGSPEERQAHQQPTGSSYDYPTPSQSGVSPVSEPSSGSYTYPAPGSGPGAGVPGHGSTHN